MTMPEHMQFCLTAPLATSAWVGDELIVHGNDAFAAFLGAKLHARVLGRPAREGFGELWAVLEPLVARAPTVAEDVRLVFERDAEHEEVFATIALARSEHGIVCTCIETTEHVVARRRLETMRELGAGPMRARTVDEACAAVIAVLRGNPHDIQHADIAPTGQPREGVLAYPVGSELELVIRPSVHRPLDAGYRAFCERLAERTAAAIDAAAAHASVATLYRREAEDEFLGLLAHELRNPLAPVLTTLDVMRMRGQTEDVELLDRPLRRLSRLLDDLLEYSRIARGTLRLQRTRVELAQVVSRAIEIAGPFADRISMTVPRAGVTLVADLERLANALAHLVINAAEHGERAAVEAIGHADRVRIAIRNEGPIPDEVSARLFEAFVQPQQGLDRPRGGLGLGLAITRRIVEMHAGTIRATTTASTTEVVIELPSEAMAVAPPRDAVRQRSRKRVLIVEDNDDTARALKNALEVLGYDVALAHDGPVALTVARAFRPDVALLDIGLPVMDGYELANRLRAVNVATRELHVVAVTAYGADAYKQRSQDAGFAEHLVKPVDLAKLERVVEALD